ncbi:MAG: xanthine dehydrogenase accessory protein XdhC [Gemmobacter sp.]
MIDLAALRGAVAAHGAVARVVVAAVAGSAPREVGAAMLVWAGGQDGTIGGGALEWEAVLAARRLLGTGDAAVERVPLGPARGQCCGGAVTLVTEVWDAARLAAFRPEAGMLARPVGGGAMPLAVVRAMARARGQGVQAPVFTGGWIAEPVAAASRAVWVWGAGHVGRAVVGVIAPLPGLAVTWVDVAAERFPAAVPPGVTVRVSADAGVASEAPPGAEHLVMTFSHALDLEICHRLLGHGFARCGLIGSAPKWARFRSRLRALGHGAAAIARIDCPIGEPGLGKHPQAIAVGVAAALLRGGQVQADGDVIRRLSEA